VKVWDPLALAAAALALAIAALIASIVPATRASAISPMSALRVE
jgi:ABC-type lipoprotein release transport system permease subunit